MSNEPPSRKRPFIVTFRQLILGGVLLAILIVVGLAFGLVSKQNSSSIANAQEELEVRPMPVNVGTIEFVDSITQQRSFTGTVVSKNRSELGFEMPGKIVEILVDEGDSVVANQPIARLDAETFTAQLNATVAAVEQANNVFAEMQSGPRVERINAARANRDAAKSQFEMAQTNLERRQGLRKQGAISSEEYDQALFAVQTGKAQLQSANDQLSELEAGTRSEKLDAQKSIIRQLEASQKEMTVAIGKSTLVAPFNGMVTRRFVDAGTVMPASTPVVRLVDQENLEATIGIPFSIASDLKIGEEHQLIVEGKPFPARLIAKIRELDAQTRTQNIIFKVDPSASQFVVSGQLCEVHVTSKSDTSGFWIPISALTKGVRGLWSVMVVVPEGEKLRVEKRDVEIIHTESNRVLAKGTLENNTMIIIDGVHRVANGQWVTANE